MPERLMNNGKSSVVLTAAAGEANSPMKKKESPDVEGIPIRKPPSLKHHFDDATALVITNSTIAPNVTASRRTVKPDCSNETQHAQTGLNLNFHFLHC